MQWQYQGKFLTGSGFLKAVSWRWCIKGYLPSHVKLVGGLFSLRGSIIGNFSCRYVKVIPSPFLHCAGALWAPLGLTQILRRCGQDRPSACGCLGHGKENQSTLSFLSEECHRVLHRARRCMREDPKIEMPCVIPSSNPVPWKSSEIGHMFQEQGRNPYGCMNWHFRSETLCSFAH